jgi:flagellar basal body-associated protein FliL
VNGRTIGVAIIAFCCVGALVFAAGTLSQTTSSGEEANQPAPEQDDSIPATDSPMDANVEGGETQQKPPVKVERCEQSIPPLLLLGLLGLVGGVTAVMYRKYDRMVALSAFFVVGVLVATTVPFVMGCPSQPVPEDQQNGTPDVISNQTASGGGGDGSGDGEQGETRQQLPDVLLLLLGVVGIAVVVVAGVWVVRSGDDDEESELVEAVDPGDEEEPPDSPDVEAVAAAAGRAADRIEEQSAVDNEIYRAWVEMTRYLPVAHPETSTPREFERAADDAGLEADAVGELTDLFESVRYGREAATTDREERAVEALRRLEDQLEGENE